MSVESLRGEFDDAETDRGIEVHDLQRQERYRHGQEDSGLSH